MHGHRFRTQDNLRLQRLASCRSKDRKNIYTQGRRRTHPAPIKMLREDDGVFTGNSNELCWRGERLDVSWCTSVNDLARSRYGTAPFPAPSTTVAVLTIVALADDIDALRGCVDVHFVHGSCAVSVRCVVVVKVDCQSSVGWRLSDGACESSFSNLFRVLSSLNWPTSCLLKVDLSVLLFSQIMEQWIAYCRSWTFPSGALNSDGGVIWWIFPSWSRNILSSIVRSVISRSGIPIKTRCGCDCDVRWGVASTITSPTPIVTGIVPAPGKDVRN
jgi:hypothetical protein